MFPRHPPNFRVIERSYLWNGVQQVVRVHVAIETWFETGARELVIRAEEISQEDLVVMVGVEQSPYVAGKLVKPGEPDPLFTASIISFFMIQLQVNKRVSLCLWDRMVSEMKINVRSPLRGRAGS